MGNGKSEMMNENRIIIDSKNIASIVITTILTTLYLYKIPATLPKVDF